jgi:hypothetical protein
VGWAASNFEWVIVKDRQERFSRWLNKHHDRHGTLWMDCFTSGLVE